MEGDTEPLAAAERRVRRPPHPPEVEHLFLVQGLGVRFCFWFWIWGVEFLLVQGLGVRVWGLGLRVWGLGLRVKGVEFGVEGFVFFGVELRLYSRRESRKDAPMPRS